VDLNIVLVITRDYSKCIASNLQCPAREIVIPYSDVNITYRALDNTAVETFFNSLKAELVWRTTFETRDQAGKALFKYINKFYNPKRRHSYLGNISPMKFEMKAA